MRRKERITNLPLRTLWGKKRIKKSIMRKGRLTRRRKGRITNLPLRTLWGKDLGRKREDKHHEERQTDKEKEGEDYKPALEKTKLLRLLTTLPLYPLQMKSDH